MFKKNILIAKFLLLILIVGCVSKNPPPASVLHSDTYSSLTSNEQRMLPEIDKIFTLEDAINVGLANSPTFEKQKISLKLAYNSFYRSLFSYLPQLSVSTGGVGFNHINNFNTGYSPASTAQFKTGDPGIAASTSFVLFDGFSRELDVLSFYEKIKSTEEAVRQARIILINEITNQYFNIVFLGEQIKIIESDCGFQRKMLQDETVKYKNNLVTYDSILNFEFNIKQSEVDLVKAKQELVISKIVFAALLGLTTANIPSNLKFESYKDLVLKTKRNYSMLGVEYYLDLAIDQRPELKGSRYSLQAAKYQLYSAWGKFAPTITANGNWGLTTSDWRYTGQYINYGISAQWDLFDNGFNRILDIREKQLNLETSKIEVLQTWIDIVKEVRTAYMKLEAALLELKLTNKAVEIAERQRDIVEEKYENQLESIERMNQTQSALVSIKLQYLSAIVNVQQLKSDLFSACGIQQY